MDRCLITVVVNKVTSWMPTVPRKKSCQRYSSSDAFIVVFTIPFSHSFRAPPVLLGASQKSSFGNFDLASLSLLLPLSGRILFTMSCISVSRARYNVCVPRACRMENTVTSAWAKRATEPHKVDTSRLVSN